MKSNHVKVDRTNKEKIQTLKTQYKLLQTKENEIMDGFAKKVNTIINGIRALGEKMKEAAVVEKFLRAMPSRLVHFAFSVEKFNDMSCMTLEELIGRIEVHEERVKTKINHTTDRDLLLTIGSWINSSSYSHNEELIIVDVATQGVEEEEHHWPSQPTMNTKKVPLVKGLVKGICSDVIIVTILTILQSTSGARRNQKKQT